jgi:hypothetical protein
VFCPFIPESAGKPRPQMPSASKELEAKEGAMVVTGENAWSQTVMPARAT